MNALKATFVVFLSVGWVWAITEIGKSPYEVAYAQSIEKDIPLVVVVGKGPKYSGNNYVVYYTDSFPDAKNGVVIGKPKAFGSYMTRQDYNYYPTEQELQTLLFPPKYQPIYRGGC